jgi:hypothetical protein
MAHLSRKKMKIICRLCGKELEISKISKHKYECQKLNKKAEKEAIREKNSGDQCNPLFCVSWDVCPKCGRKINGI